MISGLVSLPPVSRAFIPVEQPPTWCSSASSDAELGCRLPDAHYPPGARPRLTSFVRVFVLGIDPGVSTPWPRPSSARAENRAVALGVVTTPADTALPARLAAFQADLRALIADIEPAVVALERVFFQANVRTAMSVGQASGLAMAEAATAGARSRSTRRTR